VRAQTTPPVRRLLDAPPRTGRQVADRVRAAGGERAAWDERAPDSWEYVMPWQVRNEQQRRLVAGGYRVRVVLRSGPATTALRPAGRS
jgi:proline dehydrogenase